MFNTYRLSLVPTCYLTHALLGSFIASVALVSATLPPANFSWIYMDEIVSLTFGRTYVRESYTV